MGDVFVCWDMIVVDVDCECVCEYFDCGGVVNVENFCWFFVVEYVGVEIEVDDFVEFLIEGVYYFDYFGVEYDELFDMYDLDKLIIGVWFYEFYWMYVNIWYVDVFVECFELFGVNVLFVFCNFVIDEEGQENVEWVVWNWFLDDDGFVVDVVVSFFMFLLLMSEWGCDVDDEGLVVEDVFFIEFGVFVLQVIMIMCF